MDIRFTIERLLLRGLHYRLFFAAAIIALVSLSAGLLVVLLDPKFDDPGAAIWWSFLRLSDPGYLGDDEGTVSVIISTVVTVLGYVLFLGLLVAILTQWMNGLIGRVESGTTRIRFKNHVLILGWNYRTPAIVLELLETRGRTLRFLKDVGARDLRIVILADHVDAELRSELKTSLGEHWDDRRVVVRAGSPLKLDGLERVAFHDAAAVILPGADFSMAQPGVADAEIIKTLASISGAGEQAGNKPAAVAALHNANRSDIARRAYSGDLEVIGADQLVSQLIAQSTLQPGLWPVYWELLSLLEKNAVFVREQHENRPATIGEARRSYRNAVVIGAIPSGTHKPILNPADETPIEKGDSLVFIAEHYADCEAGDAIEPSAPANISNWGSEISNVETVLIMGWSRIVPKVLENLLDYQRSSLNIDVVGLTPVEERETSIGSVLRAQEAGTIRHVESYFMDPDETARIHPEKYDAVLMVARERLGSEAVADAGTITAYLTVDAVIQDMRKPHFVVELQDDENAPLFRKEDVDAIVSPMIVSYILSQVALEPELGLVLQQLTRSRGTTIQFRTLDLESAAEDCAFVDLREQAAARGETAIGVVTNTAGKRQSHLNPGAGVRWSREEIERVIVIATVSQDNVIQ
jgi:Trk K+ transport system NAD-binding subunit